MENTMQKRLKRNEVNPAHTWDLTDLFPSRDMWLAELDAIKRNSTDLLKFAGRLGEGGAVLFNALEEFFSLQERMTKAGTYASLRQSADGTDPLNQSDMSIVGSLSAEFDSVSSFIKTELLALPDGWMKSYTAEEPRLKSYCTWIEKLLSKKEHMLSAETELALAALGETFEAPYYLYSISKASDMEFDPIMDKDGCELPMSFALYEDRYELAPDTDTRRNAYKSFTDTLRRYRNTYAMNYATEVKSQMALAKLRKFSSATHMLLHEQQVTLEMYNNQLDVILKELVPHMRRFARLKKEVLGLDKLMYCDLKAPLDPDYNPGTTFEEASEVILEALKVMGSEYHEVMRTALTERWVDLADNVGKSTGAFCSSPDGAHPYILITWTDTMRGAFVLAHELGHAGHFYLAGKNQLLANTRPSLYFVEAPSTMNEMLLGDYLLKRADSNRMKRWVILQLLGTYYHNFVTHLLEAEFQRRVYRSAQSGISLTADFLSATKSEVLSDFWGDEVEIDEGASLTWMRQPHYYMGLYPYTYSAGLTISTAVAQSIKEEGQPAVERWLEVLKAGGTLKPLELAKKAGVDMSGPASIKKAVDYVGSLITELENSYL